MEKKNNEEERKRKQKEENKEKVEKEKKNMYKKKMQKKKTKYFPVTHLLWSKRDTLGPCPGFFPLLLMIWVMDPASPCDKEP